MPGLDGAVVKNLDFARAIARIKKDISTDFVPSPHLAAIYAHAADDLIKAVSADLTSGRFEAQLPVTIEVPKRSGLTRPGAILYPADRLVYQALTDSFASTIEEQLDRDRVFSNVLIDPDPENEMFEPQAEAFARMTEAIESLCSTGNFPYVIRADVSNFFERVYQHNVVNLLHSSGCEPEPVKFLERLLSAWMDKDSHGILQGMFPSDLLGNFYLCGLDADFEIRGIPSVRFVDDLYLFFEDLKSARETLIHLCSHLRREGLNLNENKTAILDADKLLKEETELDRLFQEARAEVGRLRYVGYGWQTEFFDLDPDEEVEQETQALETLYQQRDEQPGRVMDKIDSFCLPWFAAIGSDVAVPDVLASLPDRPHMTRIYCNYLGALAEGDQAIVETLEIAFREPSVHSDWQILWPCASLINAPSCSAGTVNEAIRILRDLRHSEAVRALCAILIAKHGTAAQRKTLRHHYKDEPSTYVRAGILYATRYFPVPERNTCLTSWGGHSFTNALVAISVKQLVK